MLDHDFMIDDTFTTVQLSSHDKDSKHMLLFGKPFEESPHDNSTKENCSFPPGSIFCLNLLNTNGYGTTEWAVYVLQAAYPGETILPVPHVTPGAKILLEAHGRKQVQAALKELTEIQKRVDPTTLPPGRFLLTDFRLKADTRTRR